MFILIKIKQKLERDPNDRIRGHTLVYGHHYYDKSLCPECSKEYEKKFKEFELFKEVNIVKCKKNNKMG